MLVVVEVDEIEDIGISEIRRVVLNETANFGSVMDSTTVRGMGHHLKPARTEESNFKFCSERTDLQCYITVGKNCTGQHGEGNECIYQLDNPHNVTYINKEEI